MSNKKIIQGLIVTYNKYNGRRLWKGAGSVTEIKRFVSYIYMYNGGVKGSNVGFAKVDSRNGQCKIAVNIKGLELSNGKSEKVYLFYRKQEKILGIYIGSFQVVNGVGEFHEQFPTQNIKAANLSLDEMNGIFIREEDRNERVFASGWDDYAILVNQFCIHKGEESSVSGGRESGMLRASEVEEKRKEPVIFFDRNWKSEELVEEQPVMVQKKELIPEKEIIQTTQTAEIPETTEEGTEKTETAETDIGVKTDNSVEKTQTTAQKTEIQVEETTAQETNNNSDNRYGQETEKQREDLEREIKRGQKMDVMQKENESEQTDDLKKKEQAAEYPKEAKEEESSETIKFFETGEVNREQKSEFMEGAEGVETVIIESSNGERISERVHTTEDRTEINQQNTDDMQKGLLWGAHTPGMWKEMSWEEYQEKEQQFRNQVQTCVYQNKNKKDEAREENLEQLKRERGRENTNQHETEEGLESRKAENLQHIQDTKETSDMANMTSIEETAWEKLCHQFPKIRAFVDEPESLCLKIDLQDLRMLSKENWVLGSNSFLLHGYYNFRYLILTQEEEEFVLGVPGIYHPNEKMMASMFGFGDFKPVKDCDKMLGQFGYWCKKVAL